MSDMITAVLFAAVLAFFVTLTHTLQASSDVCENRRWECLLDSQEETPW